MTGAGVLNNDTLIMNQCVIRDNESYALLPGSVAVDAARRR